MKNKKLVFANSKNGWGGILNKNAFTLIELLAIIVILAIIAVITVPIILNIIENSKKGAATDSAYGYKDAVNKTYIQEMAKPNNGNLKLDGIYTVQNDGTLVPSTGYTFGVTGYNSLPVSLSGDKPSSGSLTYSNNVLTSGCLVIGDYAVVFENGSVSQTIKGVCPNPYETKFDGTYTYSTVGQYEVNGNGFVPVAFNNEWKVYIRNDGIKNEVCGLFPNGTVCFSNNITESDFEDCSDEYEEYDGTGNTCIKGYSKAKLDEMLSKGATDCQVGKDSVYCHGFGGCTLESFGQVECHPGIDAYCYLYDDGSVFCEDE